MRVVHLYRYLTGKISRVWIPRKKAAKDIPNRTCHQKIFLRKTLIATCIDRVGRIEHLAYSLGLYLFFDGAQVIACVEDTYIKHIGSACRKESKCIYGMRIVPDDWKIVRNSNEDSPTHPHGVIVSLPITTVLDMPIDRNYDGLIQTLDEPR